MTLSSLYKEIQQMLEPVSDCAAFEASTLCMHALELTRTAFYSRMGEAVPGEAASWILETAGKRKDGLPLQYLLGEWEFYGLPFYVNEHVLIPRPETEGLAELFLEEMKTKEYAVVYDLCAGSGCIGITIAAHTHAEVYALELSEPAIEVLNRNRERNHAGRLNVLRADIKEGPQGLKLPKADYILSNPPYILASDLPMLQTEVLKEPALALDGGRDGLDFYRALCSLWIPQLNPGGAIAVECGEGQAEEIARIMEAAGLQAVEMILDYNGIERIVSGRMPNS